MPAMADGSDAGACYYSLLGIRRKASLAEIRRSYRKLALKWHPDRRRDESPAALGDAKRRFQRIQQAYSVLSDSGKRAMYDAGIFDPFDEEDQDFTDFMEEMISMMGSRKSEEPETLKDLQKIFAEMVGGMEAQPGPHNGLKRTRVGPPTNGGGCSSPLEL